MAFPLEGMEVVLNWSLPNGSAGASVLHGSVAPGLPPSDAELQNVANAVKDWYENVHGAIPAGKGLFNQNLTLVDAVCTARGDTPQRQKVAVSGVAGSTPGIASPNEGAIVTTWYTGVIGKSYRGRTFWPGYDPDILDNSGKLIPADVTTWTTVFGELRTLMNATIGSFEMGVYSRLLGVVTPITSVVTRNIPHHQRRRNA